MRQLIVHPGVYPDADSLGPRLRGIDKLEVSAMNKWTPEQAIRESIDISSKWWVGTIDGQEECVAGVAPIKGLSGWGAPWMLCTDKVFHGAPAKTFLRRSREFVTYASEGYDCLFNLISEHNYASRRWLRYAGFSIKEQQTHSFGGFRFLEFIYVVPGGAYDQDD